ncbi:MAG: PKD domain-containing protein [Thermoplasmatota archaeon]
MGAALILFVSPASAWGYPNTASYPISQGHIAGMDGGKYVYVTSCDAPACTDPGVPGGLGSDPAAPAGGGPFFQGDAFVGRPAYNWVELSGTAANKLTANPPFYGTAGTVSLPPGFTFTFYGKKETSYTVCQQGALVFPDPSWAMCNYAMYGYSEAWEFGFGVPASYMVAPYWAPLYLDPSNTAAGIFHATLGTPGNYVDIVEWKHMQMCAISGVPDPTGLTSLGGIATGEAGQQNPGACVQSGGDISFEVKLFQADNSIEYHYQHTDLGGISQTSDPVGTPGTEIGTNGETAWGGTHGLPYWFGPVWNWGNSAGNPFLPGGTNFCEGEGTALSCPTFGLPDAFALRFYKELVPTGANINATVNEGVPTLIQLQGTDPGGRPLFASVRPAVAAWGSGGTGPSLAERELPCNPGGFNATRGVCTSGVMRWASLVSPPRHGTAIPVNPDVSAATWKSDPACPAGQNCNGFILYTGNPDYNGPDSFTFEVSDGFAKDPTLYTATIQVLPINDPPYGVNDTIQVWDAGHPTTVAPADGELAIDYDPEVAQQEGPNGICWDASGVNVGCPAPNQSLHVNMPTVTRPAHADAAATSWVPTAAGGFDYLVDSKYACAQYPLAAGQNGQTPCLDSFVYQPCDDNSVSTQMWSLPSPPTNVPTAANNGKRDGCDGDPANIGGPVNLNTLSLPAYTRLTNVTLDIRHWVLRAIPDAYQAIEDNALIVATQDGVMANDPGAPNATRMVIEDTPTHGALSPEADGSFTYTPFPNLCDTPGGVPDAFHYHLEDASRARGNTVAVTISLLCVDDPPIWIANQTTYKLPNNFGALSDRFWALGPGATSVEMLDPNWVNTCAWCGWAPGVVWVQRPDGVLPGPCTPAPPSGIVDECTTQKMQFVVDNDNPTLFAAYGQPSVTVYQNQEFTKLPFRDSQRPPAWTNDFRPEYGWLNFTVNKFSYGVAHLKVCLKDDGIDSGSASGPGSIDRSCQLVTVVVPRPPMTHPDEYLAYSGRLMMQTNYTGVLANDQNSTGTYYLANLNPPDAGGVRHGTYLTATLFSAPSHAVNFGLNPDGSFSYLPDPAFQGTDVFRYMATDLHYRSIVPETVTITVTHNLPPGADFVWQPAQPVANQRVQFQDRSGVVGAAIVSWAWDFGDGSSAGCMDTTCRFPDHVYGAQGLYAVRLSIVDSKGDVDQVTRTVNVGPAGPSTDARYVAPNYAAPIANAGHDFAVAEGSAVRLTGSGEPANNIASYLWTQRAGPKVRLDNPSSAATDFTAPLVGDAPQVTLTFSLVVSDGVGESPPSVVHVLVESRNHPAVAHAGVPQSVASGADVLLDGSGSQDGDGDSLTYLWSQVDGPGVQLVDPTAAVAHFVAPATVSATTLTFQLQVADGHTAPSFDRVMVHVRPVEAPSGFSFTVGGLAEPGRVAFTGGSATAAWDFGDGTSGFGADPIHTYQKSGTYLVTLTVGPRSYEQGVTVAFHQAIGASVHQSPALGWLVLAGLLVVAVRRRSLR